MNKALATKKSKAVLFALLLPAATSSVSILSITSCSDIKSFIATPTENLTTYLTTGVVISNIAKNVTLNYDSLKISTPFNQYINDFLKQSNGNYEILLKEGAPSGAMTIHLEVPGYTYKDKTVSIAGTPAYKYTHDDSNKDSPDGLLGKQGIATDGSFYYVSGNQALYKYDLQWKMVYQHLDIFKDFSMDEPYFHIGDIEYHNGKIYTVAEYFNANNDDKGSNFRVGIFDATKEGLPVLSGGVKSITAPNLKEVSGITYNNDDGFFYVCSWYNGDDSGQYLYKYNNNFKYISRKRYNFPVYKIQAISYHDKAFFLACDDSTMTSHGKDHFYRVDLTQLTYEYAINREFSIEDACWAEMEGLTFSIDGNLLSMRGIDNSNMEGKMFFYKVNIS